MSRLFADSSDCDMRQVVEPRAGYAARLQPAGVARVWVGDGRPHETIAVLDVTLAPGDVLVSIELATVCGSDVHTVLGHRPAPAPLVLGHEYVGRVVALGEGAVRTVDGAPVHIGDRIVWSIFAACGTCDRCGRGMPQKCRGVRKYGHERIAGRWELNGGFASHAHVVSGTAIVKVSERLPAVVAAPAACGTATAFEALAAAAQIAEVDASTVIVCGAGLIGLTATAMATEAGARVIVVDPDAGRRELAVRFGAVAAIAPGDDAGLAEATGEHEVSVVLEASGARASVMSAMRHVGIGGVVVYVGSVFATEPVPLDPEWLVRSCVTLRGVHNYPPAALSGAVRFLESHAWRFPFDELVGESLPLSELDAALRVAAAPAAPIRVGIIP